MDAIEFRASVIKMVFLFLSELSVEFIYFGWA